MTIFWRKISAIPNSENFIVPYVENVYPKDIIKKIIIGPCNDFERSTYQLNDILILLVEFATSEISINYLIFVFLDVRCG